MDGEPLCVMLPLLDMANHDPGSANLLLDSGGASLLVHAGDGIAEGEEVPHHFECTPLNAHPIRIRFVNISVRDFS